ncbi:pyridoxal phosphate-dependent aminotransferase [Alistipes putredinis]|uniref:pyridoxal phosphate-dependent aminotransferase n=1 Tax=Alistipes putredinis TaxID=28117 RepID=UPI003AB20E2C
MENVEEYYFSVKLKEVARMNESGARVINLGIGSPDLPPSAETVQALCQAAARPDTHGYQPYVGIPELRAEFARWYKRWYGVDLDPANEILPLIGSKEGVMHISLAFLNEGDGVLIPNPGYPTYASVSKLTGARILPYALKEENDWQPDFEALEKMDLSGVKLMWCNYPNMPTGANGSRELFEKLVAFGRRHNIVICHDNPYSFILNDRPLSILSVPGAKEICIELNSMSKTFNMPGWRIGMVATNSRFLEWILRVKSNMDSGMFRPMQLAAVEALKAPDSWYQRMNEVYRRRRALAARILETLGCDVRDDQVGMFLWGRVNDTLAAQLTAAGECPNGVGEAICNRVLYQSRVFVTPGFIFGSEGRNYIRISLCCNEEMLQEALDRITTTRTKQNQ